VKWKSPDLEKQGFFAVVFSLSGIAAENGNHVYKIYQIFPLQKTIMIYD